MHAGGISLRSAKTGEIKEIRSLLKNSGLPCEDVEPGRQDLIVALRSGEVVGCVGVERYGEAGLLRSLAVKEACRGHGMGKALVAEAVDRAVGHDVRELYLLTLTAERFFLKLGFERVDRASAPDAIRGTTEFESICPVSSACMKKKIG